MCQGLGVDRRTGSRRILCGLHGVWAGVRGERPHRVLEEGRQVFDVNPQRDGGRQGLAGGEGQRLLGNTYAGEARVHNTERLVGKDGP
jgi:hypothetical protein